MYCDVYGGNILGVVKVPRSLLGEVSRGLVTRASSDMCSGQSGESC